MMTLKILFHVDVKWVLGEVRVTGQNGVRGDHWLLPRGLLTRNNFRLLVIRSQFHAGGQSVGRYLAFLKSAKLKRWGNHWSCQWKSLCVIFHLPFHLSKVNTSEARALAPANLPDQR